MRGVAKENEGDANRGLDPVPEHGPSRHPASGVRNKRTDLASAQCKGPFRIRKQEEQVSQ